jgi:hypothetical protein
MLPGFQTREQFPARSTGTPLRLQSKRLSNVNIQSKQNDFFWPEAFMMQCGFRDIRLFIVPLGNGHATTVSALVPRFVPQVERSLNGTLLWRSEAAVTAVLCVSKMAASMWRQPYTHLF